jgi:hypothetical protein
MMSLNLSLIFQIVCYAFSEETLKYITILLKTMTFLNFVILKLIT